MSKQHFRSMGQQASSLGRSVSIRRVEELPWPQWAKEAYLLGYFNQSQPSWRRYRRQLGKTVSEPESL